MPPGYLGQARLRGGPPVVGYFQPVSVSGPEGVTFSLADNGQFQNPVSQLEAGFLVGQVYRFRITGIRGYEGAELYPTLEVIDRTYPPPGLATRYPIRIDLDHVRLRVCTEPVKPGDPRDLCWKTRRPPYRWFPRQQSRFAPPRYPRKSRSRWKLPTGLGRPVAIVRIGSMAPPRAPEALLPQFFFGYPTWAPFPEQESAPEAEGQPSPTAQPSQP